MLSCNNFLIVGLKIIYNFIEEKHLEYKKPVSRNAASDCWLDAWLRPVALNLSHLEDHIFLKKNDVHLGPLVCATFKRGA